MTTARDVILRNFNAQQVASFNAILDFLVTNGPESVRLELTALLNPWRPIETAPKDTWVQVTRGGHFPVVAKLSMGVWLSKRLTQIPMPIHWLPLPAPPSEDK